MTEKNYLYSYHQKSLNSFKYALKEVNDVEKTNKELKRDKIQVSKIPLCDISPPGHALDKINTNGVR